MTRMIISARHFGHSWRRGWSLIFAHETRSPICATATNRMGLTSGCTTASAGRRQENVPSPTAISSPSPSCWRRYRVEIRDGADVAGGVATVLLYSKTHYREPLWISLSPVLQGMQKKTWIFSAGSRYTLGRSWMLDACGFKQSLSEAHRALRKILIHHWRLAFCRSESWSEKGTFNQNDAIQFAIDGSVPETSKLPKMLEFLRKSAPCRNQRPSACCVCRNTGNSRVWRGRFEQLRSRRQSIGLKSFQRTRVEQVSL